MEANSSGAAHYLRRTCPPVPRGPPLCTVAQGKAKRGGGGGEVEVSPRGRVSKNRMNGSKRESARAPEPTAH